MKLKTVRVRRNRPSVLSAALALMLTMLFVYLISLSAASRPESAPAASQAIASSDVRMDGLSAAFECEGRYDLPLDARVAAAKCVQSGGAGLILPDGAQYAVVRSVSSAAEGENVIRRSAPGLTLRVSGPASELMAVADAVDFLRAQTTETGSLAQTLESGGADITRRTDRFTHTTEIRHKIETNSNSGSSGGGHSHSGGYSGKSGKF